MCILRYADRRQKDEMDADVRTMHTSDHDGGWMLDWMLSV